MDYGVLYISLVMTILAHYTAGSGSHIITDPHVDAALSGDFTLNCRLSLSDVSVTQVQWSWGSAEKPKETIVVFHKQFGTNYSSSQFRDRVTFFNHSQHHVSIRVTDVTMNDTGSYTCEYTTYPSGKFQATTTVTVTEQHGGPLWILGTGMAALLLTVLLAASVYFTLKHARKNTSARSRPDQSTSDQNRDLNYAEVGFFRKAGGTKVPQSKTDVEYGEVVFPSQPSSASSPAGQPNADEGITYAEVKRA